MLSPTNKIAPSELQLLSADAEKGLVITIDNEGTKSKSISRNRDLWQWKIEPLFAAAAFSVNVRSVWSFPAMCFKYGGAAFCVPYFLTLILCGTPLYILETTLGSYATIIDNGDNRGLLSSWNCSPLFKGIGYAAVLINLLVSIYYAVYGAWTIYYIAASFRQILPWRTCNPIFAWVSSACSTYAPNCTAFPTSSYCANNQTTDRSIITDDHYRYKYGIDWISSNNSTVFRDMSPTVTPAFSIRFIADQSQNQTTWFLWNDQQRIEAAYPLVWRLPAHDFFHNDVLRISNGIVDFGKDSLDYRLILCLLLICSLVFVCLLCGARSTGKAYFILITLSYICSSAILIRVIFLPRDGPAIGLKSYLYPKWNELMNIHAWGDAGLLAIFTLFPAWGSMANIASRMNGRSCETCCDSLILTIGSGFSSVYFGFIVAMLIGVLADNLDISPLELIVSGPDLIYIAMAQAFTFIPYDFVWSILMYFAFLSLILGTLLNTVETVSSLFGCCVKNNSSPSKCVGNKNWRYLFFNFCLCAIIFLVGLALIYKGGFFVTMLFDRYSNWWNTLLLAFLELIVISMVQLYNETENASIKRRISCLFTTLWKISAAVVLLLLITYSWYNYEPTFYGHYQFPIWADAIGWLLTVIPLLIVPLTAVIIFVKTDGDNVKQKFRNSIVHCSRSCRREEEKLNLEHGLQDQEYASGKIAQKIDDAALDHDQPLAPAPLPEMANLLLVRIAATEIALKPGKVNRGTQMSRDIAAQTGDENGENAFVEYDQYFDGPEFSKSMARGSSKRRKKKHKEKKNKVHTADQALPVLPAVYELDQPVPRDVDEHENEQAIIGQNTVESMKSYTNEINADDNNEKTDDDNFIRPANEIQPAPIE